MGSIGRGPEGPSHALEQPLRTSSSKSMVWPFELRRPRSHSHTLPPFARARSQNLELDCICGNRAARLAKERSAGRRMASPRNTLRRSSPLTLRNRSKVARRAAAAESDTYFSLSARTPRSNYCTPRSLGDRTPRTVDVAHHSNAPLPSSRIGMSSSTYACAIAAGVYRMGEVPGEDAGGLAVVAPAIREHGRCKGNVELAQEVGAWEHPVVMYTEELSDCLGIDWPKYLANLEAAANAPPPAPAPAPSSARPSSGGSGQASARFHGSPTSSRRSPGRAPAAAAPSAASPKGSARGGGNFSARGTKEEAASAAATTGSSPSAASRRASKEVLSSAASRRASKETLKAVKPEAANVAAKAEAKAEPPKVETKKVEPPKEVKKAPEKEVKAPAAEPAAQEVKKKPAKEAKIAATPPVSSRRPASATSTPPVSSRAKDASSGIVSIRHSGAPSGASSAKSTPPGSVRGRGTGGGPPVNREPPKKGPTLPPKIEKKADVPRNVIYTRDGRMIDVTMISDNESLILERVEGHANVTAPSTTHSSVKKYLDDEGKHNLTSRTKRDEEGKIMPFSLGITPRDKDGKAVPFSFFGGVDAFGGLFNGLTSMMSSTTSTTTAKTPRRDPAAAPSQKKRPDSSAEKSSPSAKPRKKDGGSSSTASGTPSASKKQIPKLQQAGETAAAASPTSPRASPAETVRRRG